MTWRYDVGCAVESAAMYTLVMKITSTLWLFCLMGRTLWRVVRTGRYGCGVGVSVSRYWPILPSRCGVCVYCPMETLPQEAGQWHTGNHPFLCDLFKNKFSMTGVKCWEFHMEFSAINPCCTEFIFRKHKMYLYFWSFLNPKMVHVVEILPYGRQGPIYLV